MCPNNRAGCVRDDNRSYCPQTRARRSPLKICLTASSTSLSSKQLIPSGRPFSLPGFGTYVRRFDCGRYPPCFRLFDKIKGSLRDFCHRQLCLRHPHRWPSGRRFRHNSCAIIDLRHMMIQRTKHQCPFFAILISYSCQMVLIVLSFLA